MCSDKHTNTIMVFRPTWTEFQDFNSYIELMEKQCAHKAGLAKVLYYKIVAFVYQFQILLLQFDIIFLLNI